MPDTITPAKMFKSNANTVGKDKYVAQFALLGEPLQVVSEDGKPKIFRNLSEARFAATEALLDALNSPVSRVNSSTRYPDGKIAKMRPRALAETMRAIDLSPELLAFIYGTRLSRVRAWLQGQEDIPHPLYLLLDIFERHPEEVAIAEEMARHVTEDREVDDSY